MLKLVAKDLNETQFSTMKSPQSGSLRTEKVSTALADQLVPLPISPAKDDHDNVDLPLKFSIIFAVSQVFFIIAFYVFTEYDITTDPAVPHEQQGGTADLANYSMFQDIHVMIFIGFGFLMTFLRSYGFSAVSLNFMVGVLSLQWGILTTGFFACQFGVFEGNKIPLRLMRLIDGDFAAASALISLGAILGKTSPSQIIVMVLIELIFYGLNIQIVVTKLGATDIGGTLTIHTFGAYFGLAVSWMLGPSHVAKGVDGHKENTSGYHADLFSMIGTLFLWCFWPSFNGAVAGNGNSMDRCVIHTALSISAACVSACIMSSFLRPRHKFNMVDVQNATLAGGVAVGAVADHYIAGGGAVLIGTVAGAWCTFGYVHIMPFLEKRIGLFDTCGIHNLHGMSGVIGGLAAVISSACASDKLYGDNIGDVFVKMGEGRSASTQAKYQLAALVSTLALGISAGLFTGYVIRQENIVDAPAELFNDNSAFHVPDDGPQCEHTALDVSVGVESMHLDESIGYRVNNSEKEK